MEVWIYGMVTSAGNDKSYELNEIKVAGTATKALDSLRKLIPNWFVVKNILNLANDYNKEFAKEKIDEWTDEIQKDLTKSFLENQESFGLEGICWARKVEVE